jgi:hypothetical protein
VEAAGPVTFIAPLLKPHVGCVKLAVGNAGIGFTTTAAVNVFVQEPEVTVKETVYVPAAA